MNIKKCISATLMAAASWGTVSYFCASIKIEKELKPLPAYQRMNTYEHIINDLHKADLALNHYHGKSGHCPDGVSTHMNMDSAMRQLSVDAKQVTNPKNDLEGMIFAKHQAKHAEMATALKSSYDRIPHKYGICIRTNGNVENFENEKGLLYTIMSEIRDERRELSEKILDNKPCQQDNYFLLGMGCLLFALGAGAYTFFSRQIAEAFEGDAWGDL